MAKLKLKVKKRAVKWAFFILVGLIIAAAYSLSKPGNGIDQDALAKCLTDNGAVMYGSVYCGHCSAQKEMFGDSFQYVDYVECTQYADRCQQDGIRGYPTWIIGGKQYLGRQDLSVLASLTGCEFEQ